MKITRRQLMQIINETLSEVNLPIPRQLKVLADMAGSTGMPKLARALSNARDIEKKDKIEDVSDDTIKQEMMKVDKFKYEATYRWVIENKSSIPDWWISMGKGAKKLGLNTDEHIVVQGLKKTVGTGAAGGAFDPKESGKSIAKKLSLDEYDKKKMKCNKPQRAAKGSKKKKTVKACKKGKERIIHYGARGYQDYTQHKNKKRRKSFRARHNCKTAKDKLTARYWACKDLWESLDIHFAPEDLDYMSPEEAYGIGYYTGKDFDVGPPTVEDAWHPSEIEAREGSWAGGDNLEDALDHSMFETGESNTGTSSGILIKPPPSIENSFEDLLSVSAQYGDRYNPEPFQDILDKGMVKLFNGILKMNGINGQKDFIKSVKKEITPIILTHKQHFNRPRPNITAEILGVDFDNDFLESAQTPSYPSGHTAQAYYIAHNLANKHPELAGFFYNLANRVSQSRIDRGVHFPTDIEGGRELADIVFKTKVS